MADPMIDVREPFARVSFLHLHFLKKRYLKIIFAFLLVIMMCSATRAQAKTVSNTKKTTFRYLAIGNSVTWHPVCSYWFHESGMAASGVWKDYVHQTLVGIKKKYKRQYSSFYCEVLTAGNWELTQEAKASLRIDLGKLLKTKRNLISIQLGDNVRSIDGFETAFTNLINFIKKRNPKAKIIVLGNWWLRNTVNLQVERIKKRVAKKCKVSFVSLSAAAGKPGYIQGMNTILYDSEGNPHPVLFEAVAYHPNDRGMAYIAKQIVKKYKG